MSSRSVDMNLKSFPPSVAPDTRTAGHVIPKRASFSLPGTQNVISRVFADSVKCMFKWPFGVIPFLWDRMNKMCRISEILGGKRYMKGFRPVVTSQITFCCTPTLAQCRPMLAQCRPMFAQQKMLSGLLALFCVSFFMTLSTIIER